jgi:hypothetical protein
LQLAGSVRTSYNLSMEKFGIENFKPENENPPLDKNSDAESTIDLSPIKKGVLGKKISEGAFADIHEVNKSEENFPEKIIKIGKTEEFIPPLLKDSLRIKFSRKKISDLLVRLLGPKFQIQPDQDFIKNGVAEYLLMKEYFGHNENELKNTSQNNRAKLILSLENSSDSFYKELDRIIGDSDSINKVVQILKKHQDDNFLPEEQTIIGHPLNLTKEQAAKIILKGKELPVTYYIYQEKIAGPNVVPLSELDENELSKYTELIEELLVFAILTKKMYFDTGKLIDTRPDEVARHPLEWFRKTANILVDKDKQKVFFIDTRLLWDKDSCIGSKGLNLIDHLGVRSIDNAIKKYTGMLKPA